jgi:TM2 domain-containing membrane protein YozV
METMPYQPPQSTLEAESVFCRHCGTRIAASATACPKCGANQNLNSKSKVAAGLLAIFLGAFGIHRFYLGQWWGLFYLLFFWAWIPGLVALVEGIVFLCTSDAKWNAKYGNAKSSSAWLVALVSILVLVPIIGILAAIAIPQYQEYVKRAEQARIEQSR